MTLAQSEATSGTQLSKASMADGGPSTNTGKARVAENRDTWINAQAHKWMCIDFVFILCD